MDMSTSICLQVPLNTEFVCLPMAAVHIEMTTGYLWSIRCANNTNFIYTSYSTYVTSERTSLLNCSLLQVRS